MLLTSSRTVLIDRGEAMGNGMKNIENNPQKNLISFIVTCKGRLAHLQKSIPELIRQKESEIILVDYSCEDFCGDWVSKNHPSVVVVKVLGEDKFSLSRARNIGAASAKGNIFVFVDADHITNTGLSSHIYEMMERADWSSSGSSPREADICGFLCVKKDVFNNIGGYDEVFKGWGGEDIDIMVRIRMSGAVFSQIDTKFITSIPHGDELRQLDSNHPMLNMGRVASLQASQLYMHIKIDVVNMYGHLDLDLREKIYASCARAIVERGGKSNVHISVDVPQNAMSKFSRRIKKSINYTVDFSI